LSLLLDTHVLLWWQAGAAGAGRMSSAATAAIDGAVAIYVSPLSFWEVATLRRLGRIELDRELGVWVHDLLGQPRMTTAVLTPEAAAWAGDLAPDFPGDPIDRLLYATARDLRLPLVTKDERLRSYAARSGEVELVW
jgi:PIN domain nuclease of toxin-antitoxin system